MKLEGPCSKAITISRGGIRGEFRRRPGESDRLSPARSTERDSVAKKEKAERHRFGDVKTNGAVFLINFGQQSEVIFFVHICIYSSNI